MASRYPRGNINLVIVALKRLDALSKNRCPWLLLKLMDVLHSTSPTAKAYQRITMVYSYSHGCLQDDGVLEVVHCFASADTLLTHVGPVNENELYFSQKIVYSNFTVNVRNVLIDIP